MFRVGVVGEVNSGKSSVINALVGKFVAKSGVDRTTKQCTEYLPEAYVGMPMVSPTDNDVEKKYTISNTPHRISYLDFPSWDDDSNQLYERYVPRCDIILFVTTADRLLLIESELSLYKKVSALVDRPTGRLGTMFLIINKSDTDKESDNVELVALLEGYHTSKIALGRRIFLYSAHKMLYRNIKRSTIPDEYRNEWNKIANNIYVASEDSRNPLNSVFDYDRLLAKINMLARDTVHSGKLEEIANGFSNWDVDNFNYTLFVERVEELLSLTDNQTKKLEITEKIIKIMRYYIGVNTPWGVMNNGYIDNYYVQGWQVLQKVKALEHYIFHPKWRFLLPLSTVNKTLLEFCMPYMDSLTLILSAIKSRYNDENVIALLKKYRKGSLLHSWNASTHIHNICTNLGDLLVPIGTRLDDKSCPLWDSTYKHVLERVDQLLKTKTEIGYMAAYIIHPEAAEIYWATSSFGKQLPYWINLNITLIKHRFRPLLLERCIHYNAYKYDLEIGSQPLRLVENALTRDYSTKAVSPN